MDCHSDSPFAMPDKFLTSAPVVIPAQAGIQWLIHLFPRSGNDHLWVMPASVTGALRRPEARNRSPDTYPLRQRAEQPVFVLAIAALRILQKALWIFSLFC